jgi:hypothetical protein
VLTIAALKLRKVAIESEPMHIQIWMKQLNFIDPCRDTRIDLPGSRGGDHQRRLLQRKAIIAPSDFRTAKIERVHRENALAHGQQFGSFSNSNSSPSLPQPDKD